MVMVQNSEPWPYSPQTLFLKHSYVYATYEGHNGQNSTLQNHLPLDRQVVLQCGANIWFLRAERSSRKTPSEQKNAENAPCMKVHTTVILNTYPRVKDRDLSTLSINNNYYSHFNSFFLRAFYRFNSLFFFALPILRLKEKCCCGFSRRLALQTSIPLSKMRPHFKNIKKS